MVSGAVHGLTVAILVILLLYLVIGGVLWVKNRYELHFCFKIEHKGDKKNFQYGHPAGGGLALSRLSSEEMDAILNSEKQENSSRIERAASLFKGRQQKR